MKKKKLDLSKFCAKCGMSGASYVKKFDLWKCPDCKIDSILAYEFKMGKHLRRLFE